MQQKSILSTFWFWLLIVGLILILTGLLIGGGMKKITGWVWAIFAIGAVLAIMGIIFAIYEWFAIQSCHKVETNQNNVTTPVVSQYVSPNISSRPKTNYVSSPDYSSISPVSSNTVKMPNSPLKSPTVLINNIPQAERGFSTTNMNLSSLKPN